MAETIELGMTAQIVVLEHVERGERRVWKVPRDANRGAPALLTEYRVLRYLNRSPMREVVPRVGDWSPGMGGFWMPYLRYPTAAERTDAGWVPNLARALRTLHSVALPEIRGLADDRPDVAGTLVQRFRALFDRVWRTDGFWAGLAGEDRPKLERVRAHYPSYGGLLPEIEGGLAHAPVALTHGHLAGPQNDGPSRARTKGRGPYDEAACAS